MIQIGLRAHDLGKLPAEQLAEALSLYKPDSIQLALSKALSDMDSSAGRLSPGYVRRLRRLFSARNIDVSILGCYINPVHPDRIQRDRALSRFEEHLRFVRDLGCSVVGTETGSCSPDCSPHPDTRNPETFDLFCRSIERLLRTAEKYAAIIGVEAVADKHTIDSIERMEQLLRRIDSPNLQVIYDPVNLIPAAGLAEPQETFFTRALDSLGPRIAAVHAKDFRMENGRKRDTLPSGTGDLDHTALFRLLQTRKPGIDVLLENGRPDTIENTLSFVRRIELDTRPQL